MHVFRSARWLLLALLLSVLPASSYAGVFISVGFAPPVLPVYEPPICPGPNMIWTPGYWAYGPDGYYWVPGAWVPAPYSGALWTPGYWGWSGGLYVWHGGYWGPHVGYYGGVNYGFGYFGIGFAGGEWRGGAFAYNTAVVHVNQAFVHNTYVNTTIVNRYTVNNPGHVAYAGGPGGINHPATAGEMAAARDQHLAATSFQTQHAAQAQANRNSYARFNGGHPSNVAASRPLAVENHAAPANMNRAGGSANVNAPRGNTNNAGRTNYQAGRPAANPSMRTNAAPINRNETQARPQAQPRMQPQSRPQAQPRMQPQSRPQAQPQQQSRPAEHPHR